MLCKNIGMEAYMPRRYIHPTMIQERPLQSTRVTMFYYLGRNRLHKNCILEKYSEQKMIFSYVKFQPHLEVDQKQSAWGPVSDEPLSEQVYQRKFSYEHRLRESRSRTSKNSLEVVLFLFEDRPIKQKRKVKQNKQKAKPFSDAVLLRSNLMI